MTDENEEKVDTEETTDVEEKPAETVSAEEHRKMQATLNQKFDGLQGQLKQAQGAREEAEAKVADLAGKVAALEADLTTEDGEINPAKHKALLREHAQTLESLDRARRIGWQFAGITAASDLALEFGLDKDRRDALAGELGTDFSSQKELDIAMREMRLRLKEEQEVEKDEKKPKKPEVDGGKPTATRQSLVDELRGLDVTKPEDRQKFLEKQEEYRQRALRR